MQIVLLRHGEAVPGSPDAERALSERGRDQARAAARWLADSGWQPEALAVSPLRRARQTAEAFIVAWPEAELCVNDLLLPEGSPQRLAEWLERCAWQRVLLVGHNPLATEMAAWLAEARAAVLGTASMALVEAEPVARGCGSLRWMRHYPDYGVNSA